MTSHLAQAMEKLNPVQREAVDWNEGAALVLAGPGSGKTTVLTLRIARILHASSKRHFRVLALTFSTKAADEMRARVKALVPELTARTFIGTFHAFCAKMLRQHGSHLGIRPDFGLYAHDRDRRALLQDALAEAGDAPEYVQWLPAIDRLRSRLISPAKTANHFQNPAEGEQVARIHRLYDEALRTRNILDFNGLILDACRLVHQVPAASALLRQVYRYWLIDEFQDTTPAQNRLLRFMAGQDFRNVFAVADENQIIYQWTGAGTQQITRFTQHFAPQPFYITENQRCPLAIMQSAQRLVAHNCTPTRYADLSVPPVVQGNEFMRLCQFATDREEAEGIADKIAAAPESWGATAVLGRTRKVLQPMLQALNRRSVKAILVQRRDEFVSPQFVWLQACLNQALRPTDRQGFRTLVNAANHLGDMDFDPELIMAETEASGQGYMERWSLQAQEIEKESIRYLGNLALRLIESRSSWRKVLLEALDRLPAMSDAAPEGAVSDACEDKAAWKDIERGLRAERGGALTLPQLVQGIALRSKEPAPAPGAVRVSTIHAAKGLEFDHVWLMGMAESLLPSWQSLKPDAPSEELEAERRVCFVAVTRARKTLCLSRADRYFGWNKQPSRFLNEMGVPVQNGTG